MNATRRRTRARVAASVLCIVATAGASAPRAETVDVVRDAREHSARTQAGDCPIALEYHLDWGSLTYRNACAQSLEAKGRALGALLDALFGDQPPPAEVESLALGRLIHFSEELAQRMALDAHGDPAWAEALRRYEARDDRSHGVLHRWVTAWIEDDDPFGPLAATLRMRGVTVRAGSVEKVLVAPPVPDALGAWLAERGVPDDARVPFDAQVWLVLGRVAPAP